MGETKQLIEEVELPAVSRTSRVDLAQMQETIEQLRVIRQFIYSNELKEGVDYGTVPGCGDKPTLLQPGAQRICMLFNVYPEYDVLRNELPDGHMEYVVQTALVSRTTDKRVGGGVGSCSSMEKKFRYRIAQRVCPKCKHDTVRKAKDGSFYCWAKIGGCGSRFQAGDASVTQQQSGLVENENIADSLNTVLKMAKKRSFVDATLSLSCISEFFTQDLEEKGELKLRAPEPAPPPAEAVVTPEIIEKAKPASWREHPQSIAYLEQFDKLLAHLEAAGRDPGKARQDVKRSWLKQCREQGSEPRPDLVPKEVFSSLLEKWSASVKRAAERQKGVRDLSEAA